MMKRILIAVLCVVGVWASPMAKRQAENGNGGAPEATPDAAAAADVPAAAPAAAAPVAAAASSRQVSRPAPSTGGASNDGGYVLPAAAELIVGNIKSTFSCDNRIYGYYADVDNDCKIFHVCVPSQKEDGSAGSLIYSFFCGNQTVFDQESLVCVHNDDLEAPCADSASHYDEVNSRFGVTDQPPAGAALRPAASAPVRAAAPAPVADEVPVVEAN